MPLALTTPNKEARTEMEFTPPASGSTRLSADVWRLICRHAMQNGNSSTREAIEQLIRRTLGNAQAIPLSCTCTEETPATAPPTLTQDPAQHNAAAALDAVLLN